ncbi:MULTISPECIES: preprotein translocase subunit YajC [unclassified Zymobacter]|uniref:preprotein translocase subunit YajC n=1 Tax=unclassified Zymobacter TaxID=3048685 RepID=UPI0039C149AD
MLDFLITAAHADGAAAPATQGSSLITFLPIIAVFILMYFMVMRPQSKRAKAQRELMSQLAKGNEIVFAGGLTGRITKVVDDYVKVEIAEGTELTIQKNAVIAVLPKGTLKNI